MPLFPMCTIQLPGSTATLAAMLNASARKPGPDFLDRPLSTCMGLMHLRPIQVLPFFRDLESLPERPDIDTLRKVFSWYDDGFLKGVDTETDPAAAWRECAPPSLPAPPLN